MTQTSTLDDPEATLIAAARTGDRTAFVKLVAAHQARVRAFVGAYLRASDEVDDVAQEVFLSAHRDLGRFHGESTLGTWLIGITRHLVLNRLRAQRRKQRSLAAFLDERRIAALESESTAAIDRERRIQALDECIQRLSGSNAELLNDHYFRVRPLTDIARRSGRGESAVRMSLLRVRQALRECIEKRAQGEAR